MFYQICKGFFKQVADKRGNLNLGKLKLTVALNNGGLTFWR